MGSSSSSSSPAVPASSSPVRMAVIAGRDGHCSSPAMILVSEFPDDVSELRVRDRCCHLLGRPPRRTRDEVSTSLLPVVCAGSGVGIEVTTAVSTRVLLLLAISSKPGEGSPVVGS